MRDDLKTAKALLAFYNRNSEVAYTSVDSGCFTNLRIPGVMYNRFTFMLDIGEPNLTSIIERYTPILNGGTPLHTPPHITLFDMRLNPRYFNDYKDREAALCSRIGVILRQEFDEKTLIHEQNQFYFFPSNRPESDFYVKFYKTTITNFVADIEAVINHFFEARGRFKQFPHENMWCFVDENRFKNGPILSIPDYIYDLMKGGEYRPHVSLFNILDVKNSNPTLYKVLEKQDTRTRLETIHNVLQAEQGNLQGAKRWNEQHQVFTNEVRNKILPFFNILPKTCTLRVIKQIQYSRGSSRFEKIISLIPTLPSRMPDSSSATRRPEATTSTLPSRRPDSSSRLAK